jgi:SAM-dependent methyltransferase
MFKRRIVAGAIGLAVTLAAAIPLALAQHGHGAKHKRFDDPAKWTKSFDDPARDKWQKPDEVIAALKLQPTFVVADIGAGTGYLAVRLARHVPKGTVYAVDLEKPMVDHLAQRAKAGGIANLRAVLASETSPNLPEPVDLVVLLNVYHHIDARPAYFGRLRSSLRPGARIAIIDFRPESPVGAPKHLRLPVAQVETEMGKAGYRRTASHDFLPRQYFLVLAPAK